jgi:coatomer subunit beta'
VKKPLKFEVKKKLISRSERVKSVELHPDLPWVLVALFSGNITIYDYTNQVKKCIFLFFLDYSQND